MQLWTWLEFRRLTLNYKCQNKNALKHGSFANPASLVKLTPLHIQGTERSLYFALNAYCTM